MQSNTQKLSVAEKLGFSLGDGAANFIFQTIMLLQLSFYTDTFGISAVAAGTLFLIGRLWGGIVDPVMGAIADRTKTRWGKFRPWILWTAVPFGIIGFLAFITPDFTLTGKIIYAYITYILLMTIYSMNNIPYSALSGVITGDMKQRTSLFSIRFVVVCLATIAIQGFALPMVNHFGKGDSAKGYGITMGIFAFLAMIFFFITFFTTKERIKPDPKQQSSLKEDLATLLKNKPWIIMFVLFVMMFVFLTIRNGNLLFFFRYYLDTESLTIFIEKANKGLFGLLGFMGFIGENANVADSVFSIMNILGQLAAIVGITISNSLAVKFGKRDTLIFGFLLSMICTALFISISPSGIMLTLILQILFNLSWGITMSLPWAMMADVADFSEWKLNRRSTGIVFAGIVVGLKVGLALGGFIGGFILSLYGYERDAITPTAISGIRMLSSIYPAIALCIVIILLFFYRITGEMELTMQNELAERRKAHDHQ
ncbi:MAG: MFS transporter [Bacteroidales bacterium]|nr:MFS transporter [Bacteroidales bacterium]MBN2763444.1 MFS transporter [Bacteroidales bacterium]